jgi:hypothetical protein
MLFAAHAPSLAHAMSSARGDAWTEICSVNGSKFVKTASDQADPATKQALHVEHCPFCATHADATAPFPSASFSIPAPDTPGGYPPLYYQSPRPLSIWTSAQSRAPPSQS